MGAILGILAILVGLFALIAVASIIQGFVLSICWGWFMVPIGFPHVGVATAIGIALVAGMLQHARETRTDGEKANAGNIIGALLSPFLVLLIAYIVHSFQ